MNNIQNLYPAYRIDYDKGTHPIGELPIGCMVYDPRCKGSCLVRWIVVAKNHYSGIEPHVTLLTEKRLTEEQVFDDSTNRGSSHGSNHWGESGSKNARNGIRAWLNSINQSRNGGFFRFFPPSLKNVVITTILPNKEWKNGNAYNTSDRLFLPSTTELGDNTHEDTYPIGTVYQYFANSSENRRVDGQWSWTRSPSSDSSDRARYVYRDGEFYYGITRVAYGVRPAMNLKSNIMVTEYSGIESTENTVDTDESITEKHKRFLTEQGLSYKGVKKSTNRNRRVTHCYMCKRHLDSAIDLECNVCGWIICKCGACGCGFRP